MTYQLGVDLGTTYTAAAVYRDGRAHIVELGTRSAAVPSVLFVKDDEALLVGEAATRRGISDPSRVAREFKRRFGDPTPLIIGGSPYAADALMAKTLRWVLDAVEEREGGPPEKVTVTHPANWGQFKRDLLEQSLRLAGLTEAETITEPEAAAIHYASNERVEPGQIVAVYDLGGGTFDAAVLRKTPDGFDIMGRPEGIEHLGGVDFDQALLAKVDEGVGGALGSLDLNNPTHAQAAGRLREEVVGAKEALSTDTDTSIPVVLPDLQTEVRVTRAELEDMLRAPLGETIAALRRALDSAGVSAAEVTKVLLVGGSSRIPLVAEMVSAELGRPVAVDAHPKHAIPLGAAIAAAGVAPEPAAATAEMLAPTDTETIAAAAAGPATLVDQEPAHEVVREREAAPVSEPRSKVPAVLATIVVLLAVLGGAAYAMGLGPFEKDDGAAQSEEPTEEEADSEEEDPSDEEEAPAEEAPAPVEEEEEAPEVVETPEPEPTETVPVAETPVETPT